MKKFFTVLLLWMSFVAYCTADIFSGVVLMPEVKNIQLKSFSAENNSAVFDVMVYNPNDFKLPVKELSGDIFLNDQNVANLEATSKKSLSALSTQLFTVPVNVQHEELINSANSVLLSGVAKYGFKGYMMTPVGELPITEQGQLTAEQIIIFLQSALSTQH